MIKVVFVVLFFTFALSACQNQSDDRDKFIFVETSEGKVRGVADESVIAFRGIPYAAPPISELRWRAPQTPSIRGEVFLADTFGNRCYQNPSTAAQMMKAETFTQSESEDCLNMNIYRPRSTESKLPVLFWVHGGGLTAGSGSRPVNQGEELAKQGIVVVSFNYRLGAFGFFAHPELSESNLDEGTYNYGLMDQIAALKWVHQNIDSFGGDASRITIAGESAGAASVNALLASPLTEGLIAGAISQSGYIRNAHPRIASLIQTGDTAIEKMGLDFSARAGDENASIQDLRALDAKDVVKATDYLTYITFAVDGYTLLDNTYVAFENSNQRQVPLLIGSNDFEFGIVPPLIQRNLMKPYFSEEDFLALENLYGGESVRDSLLYSDYVFHSQARALASLHARSGLPVYMYRFAVASEGVVVPELDGQDIEGASHAGDLPYMFGNFTGDHKEPTDPSELHIQASKEMMAYWTNFVKKGNPNGENLARWEPFDGESLFQVKLGGSTTMADPWTARLDRINLILGDISSYLPSN